MAQKPIHFQGARATACGKNFGWRVWITCIKADVTCPKCRKVIAAKDIKPRTTGESDYDEEMEFDAEHGRQDEAPGL